MIFNTPCKIINMVCLINCRNLSKRFFKGFAQFQFEILVKKVKTNEKINS